MSLCVPMCVCLCVCFSSAGGERFQRSGPGPAVPRASPWVRDGPRVDMAWPDLGVFSAVPPQALWLRAPGRAAEELMISADALGIR